MNNQSSNDIIVFLQIRFNRPFNSRLVAIDCKSSCIYIKSFFRGDKKCCRFYSGLGYGCDHCRVNPSEWNDIEKVKAQWPYPLDRNKESMERVRARMSVDANGDYKKKTNDWDAREGCVRPMAGLRDTDNFPLTHKVSVLFVP